MKLPLLSFLESTLWLRDFAGGFSPFLPAIGLAIKFDAIMPARVRRAAVLIATAN